MGTVEALQGLYVALGGDSADVKNITIIPDVIAAVAAIAKSTAEPYIVTITVQASPGDTSGTGTTDKALSEIEAAYNAGRKIILRQDNGQYGFWDVEIFVAQNNGASTSFVAYSPIKNPGGIRVITISADNALAWEILPFDAAG